MGFLVEYEPIPPVQSGVMVDSFTLQEAAQPLYALPEESLERLQGENAYGTWQLEIWDTRTGATNQVSLLDWQLQFVFVTNTATARGLRPCEPFTAKIPPGQIFYYVVDVPGVATFATNFLGLADGGRCACISTRPFRPGSEGRMWGTLTWAPPIPGSTW